MKNKSELLLEGYLRHHGYQDFDFEPEMAGTSKRPDYRLRWAGGEVLLEVKEFQADQGDFKSGFGFFDPYPPLREKIEQGRDKFKKLKDHCCVLVLFNVNKPLILLDWQHVYGAMLGKLGFSVPLHVDGPPPAEEDHVRSVFLGGGKMHRESKGVIYGVQNQTISAIIVLGRAPIGDRLFHAHMLDVEAQMGPDFDLWSHLPPELESSRWTLRDPRRKPLRVVVHENPYARIPLSRDLFRGPWDERFGEAEGRVQQLYQGDEVAKMPPKD